MCKALMTLTENIVDKDKIPLNEIARVLFKCSINELKRKIKLGDIPKTIADSIQDDYIPKSALLNRKKIKRLNSQQQILYNSVVRPDYLMYGDLLHRFGTALVPYDKAAEYIFGWSKKTAITRLRSGEIKEMGLVTVRTYDSTHAPVFVLIQDIISFILANKSVVISIPDSN